jgi:hypothetical protein
MNVKDITEHDLQKLRELDLLFGDITVNESQMLMELYEQDKSASCIQTRDYSADASWVKCTPSWDTTTKYRLDPEYVPEHMRMMSPVSPWYQQVKPAGEEGHHGLCRQSTGEGICTVYKEADMRLMALAPLMMEVMLDLRSSVDAGMFEACPGCGEHKGHTDECQLIMLTDYAGQYRLEATYK